MYKALQALQLSPRRWSGSLTNTAYGPHPMLIRLRSDVTVIRISLLGKRKLLRNHVFATLSSAYALYPDSLRGASTTKLQSRLNFHTLVLSKHTRHIFFWQGIKMLKTWPLVVILVVPAAVLILLAFTLIYYPPL